MTFNAGVFLVTIITNGVNLLLSFLGFGNLLNVMAVAAVFLFMAVNTAKSEEVDVFLMLEGDYRSLGVWGFVDFLDRFSYYRMLFADDVGRILNRRFHSAGGTGNMTKDALGVVTPFAVTRETLAMIGTFEIRFLQVS